MTLLKKGLFHCRDTEDAEFYPVLGYRFEFLRYFLCVLCASAVN